MGVCTGQKVWMNYRRNVCVCLCELRSHFLCWRHPDMRFLFFLLNKIKNDSFLLPIMYTPPMVHTLTHQHRMHIHIQHIRTNTHTYACTVTQSLLTWYTSAKSIETSIYLNSINLFTEKAQLISADLNGQWLFAWLCVWAFVRGCDCECVFMLLSFLLILNLWEKCHVIPLHSWNYANK